MLQMYGEYNVDSMTTFAYSYHHSITIHIFLSFFNSYLLLR